MGKNFAKRDEYKNYIPVSRVREKSILAEDGNNDLQARLKAVEDLRYMAHAHALASESANARIWDASNGELKSATALSTASGQLFLRSSRQERLHFSDDQNHLQRIYFDRINAALEFLGARRQAIAAAIARTTHLDTSPGANGMNLVLGAICDTIANSGCPNSDYLNSKMQILMNLIESENDPRSAFGLAVAGITLEFLDTFGRALKDGELEVARAVVAKSPQVEKLLGCVDDNIADIFWRYFSNADWILQNSVWNLPGAAALRGQTAKELVQSLLDDRKAFLFPSQWEGIRVHDITNPKQMNIISMPTGSGKSLLAELVIIRYLASRPTDTFAASGRVFFIVPSRALAREKMLEIRTLLSKMPSLNAKVCQLTGDVILNAADAVLKYDVIVATPEKFDMLLRESEIRVQIGVVVVDEFHNIREGVRGFRLLSTLARLRRHPETDTVTLHLVSAIVKSDDIDKVVKWVAVTDETALVNPFRSSEPPMFTRCGVFDYESQRKSKRWRIEYDDGTALETDAPHPSGKRAWASNQHSRAADMLAIRLLADGPTLIFTTSAKWRKERGKDVYCPPVEKAVQLAAELEARPIWIDEKANAMLVAGFSLLWGDAHPIVTAARKGVVPHWGGLPLRGRRLVERAVVRGGVALLVATSTLAEGVNLPLRRLIIPKCTVKKRAFSTGFFLNLKGRAGRPFLTEEGEVVLVASKDTNLDLVSRLAQVSSDDVEPLVSPITISTRQGEGGDEDEDEETTTQAQDLEDAIDASILAVLVEGRATEDTAIDMIVEYITLDREEGRQVSDTIEDSLGRLTRWEIIVVQEGVFVATAFGMSVYRSGFAPSDAADTYASMKSKGTIDELIRKLPETPQSGAAYDALVLLMTMMRDTRSWRKIKDVQVKSAEQAALFLKDWTRGKDLAAISKERKGKEGKDADRLYLHSMLECVLAPTAAWFLNSLACWIDTENKGTGQIVARLMKWAEFVWFGAPPGNLLRLLQQDFEGELYRDDAIRVIGLFGRNEFSQILDGVSRMTEQQLSVRIRNLGMTLDSADKIARMLFRIGSATQR